MPTAVFLLGTLSIIMLFGVYVIAGKQKMTFEHVDSLMVLQIKTALFHLKFEEAVSEGRRRDVEKAFADIEDARALMASLRSGGTSGHGTVIAPLGDPAFLRDAERIESFLLRLKEIGLKRADQPAVSGPGTAIDQQFDAVFEEFQTAARTLDLAIERDRLLRHAETMQLLFAAIVIWVCIVVGATAGLYTREHKRRRAEQALERAYEEMEQRVITRTAEKVALQAEAVKAAHLASIGELAAGVAHEINNPINGIINYARILSNKSARGSSENDVAERIAKEGRRIAGIVKSLLSFARAGQEEKKPVSVESILREALTLTESQMRKEGIRLRADIPPGLPEIHANQQQIQQVFMNIINNAQYALNQKYPGEHAGKALDITGEEVATGGGPLVRVTFYDRGTGIPPEALDKIMNPFFTTKPAGRGTGLGLSISHGIIADHSGRISVQSVQGEYTKVLVDLPAGGTHG